MFKLGMTIAELSRRLSGFAKGGSVPWVSKDVPAQVGKPVVCEAAIALGEANRKKLFPKPHIYPVHYPKSRRVYWRVSRMSTLWNAADKRLFDDAHRFAGKLNIEIGDKIIAERLAKKESKK